MPCSVTTASVQVADHNVPLRVEVLESRHGLASSMLKNAVSSEPTATQPASPLSPRRGDQLFIMFPGNPGMAQFYTEFAELLVKYAYEGLMGSTDAYAPTTDHTDIALPQSTEKNHRKSVNLDVLVIGLAGHSFEELNEGKVFELKDQVAMAIAATKLIISNNKLLASAGLQSYAHIYIGGHSIGGYITTHVAEACRDEEIIHRIFLLAPTLCYMRDSPEGKSKQALINRSWCSSTVAMVAGALRATLPSGVLKWCISKGEPSCTGQHAETVSHVLRAGVLRNVFKMAKAELETVYELDAQKLDGIKSKVVAWFPKDDHWSPLSNYRLIAKAMGIANSHSDEELLHADNAEKIFGFRAHAGSTPEDLTPPICAVDTDNKFVHAWCLSHNDSLVRKMIMPFCTASQ